VPLVKPYPNGRMGADGRLGRILLRMDG